MPEPTPDISVVVPVYNQARLLRRLLDSFERLENAEAVEIILVDDCSTDDTPDVVAQWTRKALPFPVEYVRLEKNGGPGRARNTGIERARAPVVAFTDSDCVVTPGWLVNLGRKLDGDARIGGVGGKVLPLADATMAARYYVFNRSLEPPVSRQYLVTCNCCYLRQALLEAGAFTGDIRTPGGEDIAASILMWKRGWRFEYDAEAVIYHDFRDNLFNFYKTWRNYGYGCGLVAHRLLSDGEMHPERGIYDVDEYWSVEPIRPTVTGVRSLLKDLRRSTGDCRKAHLNLYRTLENEVLRCFERLAYVRGWRRGAARHRAETS